MSSSVDCVADVTEGESQAAYGAWGTRTETIEELRSWRPQSRRRDFVGFIVAVQ